MLAWLACTLPRRACLQTACVFGCLAPPAGMAIEYACVCIYIYIHVGVWHGHRVYRCLAPPADHICWRLAAAAAALMGGPSRSLAGWLLLTNRLAATWLLLLLLLLPLLLMLFLQAPPTLVSNTKHCLGSTLWQAIASCNLMLKKKCASCVAMNSPRGASGSKFGPPDAKPGPA